MGMIIAPHEIYFGSFFERFNARFGPAQPTSGSVWQAGGIAEIAVLQKQFGLFRPDRQFVESAALLGLTGAVNSPARDRWVEYLERLPNMVSDVQDQNGDQRIVSELIKNLSQDNPLPCYLEAHDGRLKEPGVVLVQTLHPVFYLESVRFLTIRLPMRPSDA